MKLLLKVYWFIHTKIFDNRKEESWECPNCHWDSTNDDEWKNATVSNYHGDFYDWSCFAHWTCPRCKIKFDTWESN